MTIAKDTTGPCISNRESPPRRSLRCSVTRIARFTAFPLLFLAGMAQTPIEVDAASITYNVVNYPALQNGYTLTGTLTTNGAIGTGLPTSDITSWNISFTNGVNSATLTPSNSVLGSQGGEKFDATTSAISIASSNNINIINSTAQSDIQWIAQAAPSGFSADVGEDTPAWFSVPPTSPFIVATTAVPEPASAVLLVLGASTVAVPVLIRRCCAKRRQTGAWHIPPAE